MSKTIAIKQDDLKGIIRMAIKMGSMNLGAKQDRLVKAVLEEAEEKADHGAAEALEKLAGVKKHKVELPIKARIVPTGEINIIGGGDEMVEVEIKGEVRDFRSPIGHWIVEDELDPKDFEPGPAQILSRASDTPPNCTCVGGCGIDGCPGYGEAEPLLNEHTRGLCARIGFPYWLATGDMTGVSDRVARQSIKLARENVNALLDQAEDQLKPLSERVSEAVAVTWDDLPEDVDEARRRQAVARATMAELDLAERQGKLISVEEADRRVAEVRKKAPIVDIIDLDDGSTAVSLVIDGRMIYIGARVDRGLAKLREALRPRA